MGYIIREDNLSLVIRMDTLKEVVDNCLGRDRKSSLKEHVLRSLILEVQGKDKWTLRVSFFLDIVWLNIVPHPSIFYIPGI